MDAAIKQTDHEIETLIKDKNFRPTEFFKMFNHRFLESYLKHGRYTRSGTDKFKNNNNQ